jgi:acyl-CoA synthetase (AMP-forming)/AMP-acid ligase II/acyl carrier protein
MRPAYRIQPNLTRPRARLGRDWFSLARYAMFASSPKSDCALESVSELLFRRASERPDQTAFVFLPDPGDASADGETAWTYRELDQRARATAAALSKIASPGDRAVLVFPPGLDFLAAYFGCLYAGVLPAPATYPKARRPSSRLDGIVADCTPRVALTTADTLETLRLDEQTPAVRALAWIAVDDCPNAPIYEPVARGRDDAAFLQYTSGSTSSPRGVTVTHGNLLHNLELIRCGFGMDPAGAKPQADGRTQAGVFWLPAYHDMGLIGGILTPLYIGGTCYLMAPAAFLQRPAAWLETISRTGAQISGAPNFAYELCARKISAEQRALLDLSKWRLAFCGAEPIDPTALEEFAAAFKSVGFRSEAFYPCYGLAESTLMVTGGAGAGLPRTVNADRTALAANKLEDIGASTSGLRLVSCGRPLGDQTVLIVDPKTRAPLSDGAVGEVWVGGDSVAAGYWNNPEASAETFGARLADGRGPLMRTGDLGAINNGELFITGRLKDLIIIRGRNLYPQDVERTAQQAHEAVDAGAAFAIGDPGHEELIVVHQVGREHRRGDMAPVIRAIRAAVVEEHEVDPQAIVLLRPGALPLTSSGKVQRGRCREMYLAGELEEVERTVRPAAAPLATVMLNSAEATPRAPKFLEHVASYTVDKLALEVQAWMMGLLAEKVGDAADQTSPESTFAELGVDSLTAIELSVEFEKGLGLKLPPAAAWSYPTPAALSHYLAESLLGVAKLAGPGGNVIDSWFAAMDKDAKP